MQLKLNVLLAKTDHLLVVFNNMVQDYIKFFKGSQSAFVGEKKTYEALPGTIDLPTERSNKIVVTTVAEKLKYFQDNVADYIDALFSQEKTNASGLAKAELIVAGTSWGELTSLELLRLKSLLENNQLTEMLANIPVRADNEEWAVCGQEQYKTRAIFESAKLDGVRKSVTKEQFIIPDPNITKETSSKYTPQIGSKDTIIELGKFSYQKFSGEWTHRLRANVLRNKSQLLLAVIEALKRANEAEAIASSITSAKIFDYLLSDK